MKNFAVLFVVGLGIHLGTIAAATTLNEAYQSALQNRSAMQVAINNLEISRQKKKQAWSAVMPTLTASSAHGWQDTAVSFGSSDTYTHTAKIAGTQKLFTGLKEVRGLQRAGQDIEIAKAEVGKTKLSIRRLVAQSFFSILSLRQEFENLKEQEDILRRRIDYLNRRASIGRSKRSEVVSARSQLARVTAEQSSNRSQLNVESLRFRWMTGLDAATIVDSLPEDKIAVNPIWRDLVEETPEVRALRASLKRAEKQTAYDLGDFFPQAAVTGNYYIDRPPRLEASKWDLTLTFSWEFFSGGYDRSQRTIRSLEELNRKSELEDTLKQRVQEYAAQEKLVTLKKDTIAKLKMATRLAKESYTQQQGDFVRGLVSNLEVLRALDDYLQVKKQYDRERFALKTAFIELQVLAGVDL